MRGATEAPLDSSNRGTVHLSCLPVSYRPACVTMSYSIDAGEPSSASRVLMIEKWKPEVDGPLTEAGLRRKLELRGYHVSRYLYHPGASFPDHTHSIDKLDAVVSGRFRMVIEGRELILEAGDTVAVPRGTVHSAEVVGDKVVISLDGTKT